MGGWCGVRWCGGVWGLVGGGAVQGAKTVGVEPPAVRMEPTRPWRTTHRQHLNTPMQRGGNITQGVGATCTHTYGLLGGFIFYMLTSFLFAPVMVRLCRWADLRPLAASPPVASEWSQITRCDARSQCERGGRRHGVEDVWESVSGLPAHWLGGCGWRVEVGECEASEVGGTHGRACFLYVPVLSSPASPCLAMHPSQKAAPDPTVVSTVALRPIGGNVARTQTTPTEAAMQTQTNTNAVVQTAPPPAKSLGFKHMAAGSLAGMASKTILQPLDLVKVRLQVQDGRGANEYKGLLDGMKSIIRKDGFTGLYRGLTPNLMASGVSWGVYFFSYNHAKNFWRTHLLRTIPLSSSPSSTSSTQPPRLGPFAHLTCAAFSGTLATIFTNPFSMVKTRLQLQGKEVNTGARMYRGVFDAFFRISREEGILTLYRGIGPSLVLVSNGALQFMSYEELKRLTIQHLVPSHDEKQLHAAHFLAMGALAKVFSATVTYPMAVTRARLYQRRPDELLKVLAVTTPVLPSNVMLNTGLGDIGAPRIADRPLGGATKQVDGKYEGMGDVITKIWRLEGWRGFYRGLVPMLVKTAPSSALTFLVYETTIKLLNAEPIPKGKKFD